MPSNIATIEFAALLPQSLPKKLSQPADARAWSTNLKNRRFRRTWKARISLGAVDGSGLPAAGLKREGLDVVEMQRAR